mgnify:CR=1 FL=1
MMLREQEMRKLLAERAAMKESQRLSAATFGGNEWSEADKRSAMLALKQKFSLYMTRGWTLSSATRDVRQSLERYAGKYSRENYAVPSDLLPLLSELNASWVAPQGSAYSCPAQYELERMLGDPRTSRYGRAWCSKKVHELFGRECFEAVRAIQPSESEKELAPVPF